MIPARFGAGGSERPRGTGSSLRSPVRRVSVIRYEQANETMAKAITNAATE